MNDETTEKVLEYIKKSLAPGRAFLDDTVRTAKQFDMQNSPASRVIVETWKVLVNYSDSPIDCRFAGPVAVVIAHLVKDPMESDDQILKDLETKLPMLQYLEFHEHFKLINGITNDSLIHARHWDEDQIAISLMIGAEVVNRILQTKSYSFNPMHVLLVVALSRYIKQILNKGK